MELHDDSNRPICTGVIITGQSGDKSADGIDTELERILRCIHLSGTGIDKLDVFTSCDRRFNIDNDIESGEWLCK